VAVAAPAETVPPTAGDGDEGEEGRAGRVGRVGTADRIGCGEADGAAGRIGRPCWA
jgi:hypothetical protein